MNKSLFLLTASGPDRPGMVAQVTRLLFELGANIEDTSMTRLGGEFSMMLVVRIPAGTEMKLRAKLPSLQWPFGITVNAKPISNTQIRTNGKSAATHLLSIYGADHTGIVYRVAQTLADQKMNITDLQTRTLKRKGKSLYVMLVELQVASAAKASALKRSVARLQKSLKLEITLQPLEAVAL